MGGASGLVLPKAALAQNAITPDATLGGEASQVFAFPFFPTLDFIQGGALRGTNLFHSFEQFSIGEGFAAYFVAPTVDTANIFARVTGGNPSEILGLLGTVQADFSPSAANLFLLNPNGILFGPGASLDIGGSFVATTADAIQFGDQGIFSALVPESDNLLEINPSALWFSGLTAPKNIEVRGDSPVNLVTLRVLEERNLTLIGGNINFDYGQLFTPGGRTNIVALAAGGIVELNNLDSSLAVPAMSQRADVVFNNSSAINAVSGGGGDISIIADNVTISNSSGIFTGIGPNLGDDESQSGDIRVDASGTVTVLNNSFIGNAVLGQGRGGGIIVQAQDISMINGSQISAAGIGTGSVGNVTLEATENISLSGVGVNGTPSGILSSVAQNVPGFENFPGQGDSGSINLRATNLTLSDRAIISSSSVFAPGRSGNIDVVVDSFTLNGGAQLFSSTFGDGNAGDVSISTRLLTVQGGSSIRSDTSGSGQGGSLIIRATEATNLIGSDPSEAGGGGSRLSTEAANSGDAGLLRLETGQLTLQDGAGIDASTFGSGSAGSVEITADSIYLTGVRADRQFASTIRSISGISSDLIPATGNAGNLSITTRLLSVEDGSSIETATYGAGQGGALTVRAIETIGLIGSGSLTTGDTSSGLATQTFGSGNAGQFRLYVGELSLQDGAGISTSTFDAGNAGSLEINADSIRLTGIRADQNFSSSIRSIAGVTFEGIPATGNAGNLSINTRLLSVEDGGSIQTTTAGPGRGGNLVVDVTEKTELIGSGSLTTGVASSGLSTGTTGSGDAGLLSLSTGQLIVRDGATVNASTFGGSGSAGNLSITADSIHLSGIRSDLQFASTIQSISGFSPDFVPATGNAGNLSISTRLLTVEDGGSIETATYGPGQGGDLTINATEAVNLTGSGALSFRTISSGLGTQAFGAGNAGNLRLATEQLTIQDGAGMSTSTFGGSGSAGNLTVDADSIRLIGVRSDGQFPSSIQSVAGLNFDLTPSTGNAGDLSINTRLLTLENGGSIQTTTSGPGRGGALNIRATEAVELTGTGFLVTSPFAGPLGSNLFTGTFGEGNAGPLNLQTDQLRLRDGGVISTRSESAGRGGDISLTVSHLDMVNGTLETEAPFSQGGNISVNTSRNGTTGLITLRGDSDITTNSFGRGGNITLNGIVIAFDDSDILARSEDAAGGNITLGPFFSDTLPVGAISPTENNNRVDVSAAGRLADGNITLPNLSFIENSLASLQEVTVDPNLLTAGSCIARSPGNQASFVVTGSGGLPVQPGDNVISAYPTGAVQTLPGADPPAVWQPGDPIVEPTGVFALPNGRLVLARACDDE
ncbi:MAG: filamentous hemagglutinin N-terminal domain-containing protein [Spirulina sp.]